MLMWKENRNKLKDEANENITVGLRVDSMEIGISWRSCWRWNTAVGN